MPKRATATRSRPLPDARPVQEISWHAMDAMVRHMAASAAPFGAQAVIGVVKGGVFVGAAMAEALGCPFYAVRISRRSRDQGLLPTPRAFGKVPRQVKGLTVLIVDDVAASGETLRLAARMARAAGAKAVKTAAISVRRKGFRPDWHAVVTEDLLVFPWDLEDPDSQRFRAIGGA